MPMAATRQRETITIVSVLYMNGEPNQLVLPAGDYGLVDLVCSQGNMVRHFTALEAQRGSLLGGAPRCTISRSQSSASGPGNCRRRQPALPTTSSGFLGLQSNFRSFVAPISESKLQAFAAHKPTLYSQIVRRPMTTPGQEQPHQSRVTGRAHSRHAGTESPPTGLMETDEGGRAPHPIPS